MFNNTNGCAPTDSIDNTSQVAFVWSVIWLGVATCFIGENFVPATHFLFGTIARYFIVGSIFVLVVLHAKTINLRMFQTEKIVMLIAYMIGAIAMGNSFALGRNPDIFYFSKLIIFNISIYLLAKLLPAQDHLKKYFQIIYYICCIASIQAAITLLADIYEVYYIGEVIGPVLGDEGKIIYPFWGLIGSHNFMRSFWYFSESAYCAQFLLIGLGFSIATRRYLGIALITLGILSSFAVAGMVAGLIMLTAIAIWSRGRLIFPVLTVFSTIFISYLLVGELYLARTKEGITNAVASVRVIEDMKKAQSDINTLTESIHQLHKELYSRKIGQMHRKEIENKLREINAEKNKKQLTLQGNLRGKDMNLLLQDLERNKIPASQLIPSDDALYRGASKIDKLNSLKTAWDFFLEYPIGGGMIKPIDFKIAGLNTGPGWVGLTLTFGCLWLFVLIPIYGFIIKRVLLTSYDPFISTMTITLGGIFLSTFWHGPHIQYHMVFMLSLLVTATKLTYRSSNDR